MSKILVNEIESKTTNENLVINPNGTGIIAPYKVPAFHAYNSSAQDFTDGTWSKVTLNATRFDTTNDFDTSTSRFTPPIKGIYHFTTNWNSLDPTNSGGYMYAEVRVNGVSEYYTVGIRISSQVINQDTQITGTILLEMSKDDYAEFWVYQNTGTTPTLRASRYFFTGHLVCAT